jgi:hypothetical protein
MGDQSVIQMQMTGVEKFVGVNARRFFRLVLGFEDKFEVNPAMAEYEGQPAADLIRKGLESKLPFAVSRYGHSELRTLLTFMHIQENAPRWKKLARYIVGEKVEPWWHPDTLEHITRNAGVFPNRIEVIEKFCRLVLADMKSIDVVGSWLGGESWIKHLMPNAKFIRFHDFYHFLHPVPWTDALKGRKVLVVHPFDKSIERQYRIRDMIFRGRHTLPEFDLITYKAVQSIAGNIPVGMDNWFQAFDRMKLDISRIDFDTAILGCGAYGMPLASFIKRDLGLQAVHLGGNTQILFGIRGNRWEHDPNFATIFNSYWVKPLPEETPIGHATIDENCYW